MRERFFSNNNFASYNTIKLKDTQDNWTTNKFKEKAYTATKGPMECITSIILDNKDLLLPRHAADWDIGLNIVQALQKLEPIKDLLTYHFDE